MSNLQGFHDDLKKLITNYNLGGMVWLFTVVDNEEQGIHWFGSAFEKEMKLRERLSDLLLLIKEDE